MSEELGLVDLLRSYRPVYRAWEKNGERQYYLGTSIFPKRFLFAYLLSGLDVVLTRSGNISSARLWNGEVWESVSSAVASRIGQTKIWVYDDEFYFSAEPRNEVLALAKEVWAERQEKRVKVFQSAVPTAVRRVVVVSPFVGDSEGNAIYARNCVRDCLVRGEAPVFPELAYLDSGVLDFGSEEDCLTAEITSRALEVGADALVVYNDLGIEPNMLSAIERSARAGVPVEYRSLV